MRTQIRPESRQEVPASPRSRSSSISSNVTSSTGTIRSSGGILAIPSAIVPPPAFVAASSASEAVLEAVSERPLSADISAVIFSEAALVQINSFLDTLLYNILANARSSTLARIKPAVDVVIKGGLGQRAIASAEHELNELLGDGEDDDEIDIEQKERDNHQSWDLDFVFRRTRLRLMVYLSLATMDDDEEERHVQENQLHSQPGEDADQFSQRTGLVSWKALMFLTTIMEYVGTACLKDAGQFACARASVSRPAEDNSTSGTASVTTSADDSLTVSEADVRKLNLSPSLGRLWRSWKKVSAASAPTSPHNAQQPWQSSLAQRRSSAAPQGAEDQLTPRRPLDALGVTEDPLAPYELPRRPNSDQTPARRSPLHGPMRTRSFARFPVAVTTNAGPGSWQGSWQSRNSTEPATESPRPRHGRSSSLPPLRPSLFATSPANHHNDAPSSAREFLSRREAFVVGPSTAPHIAELMRAEKAAAKAEAAADKPGVDRATANGDALVSPVAPSPAPNAPISTSPSNIPQVVTPVDTVQEKAAVTSDGPQKDLNASPSRSITDDVIDERREEEKMASAEQVEPHRTAEFETPAIVVPSPSSPADDDEYDPFRADQPAKKPHTAKPANSPTPPKVTPSPPEKQTPKYVFEEEDDKAEPKAKNINKQGAEVAAGVAVTAGTVAAATAALKKREKPAPIELSKKAETTTPNVKSEGPIRPVEPVRPSILSPLKMSPVQVTDYQTPASTTAYQGMVTPDANDVFVTPQGSPTSEKPAAGLPEPTAATSGAQPSKNAASGLGNVEKQKTRSSNYVGTGSSINTLSTGNPAPAPPDREFNELVSGESTVKRSLTPRNLKEIEQPDSHKRRQEVVKSVVVPNENAALEEASSKTAPSSEAVTAAVAATAAMPHTTSHNAPAPAPIVTNVQASSTGTPYVPRSPRWSTPALNSKPSKSGLTARDSRVQATGATAELATFLRETSPKEPPAEPKPFIPSSRSPDSASAPKAKAGKGSASATPSSFMSKYGSGNSRSGQERSARSERQNNDDLIAFLNDGPPGAHVNKTRSMETTGSSVNAAFSPANRSGSPISHAPSFNESINSHSNLIGGGRRGGSNPALSSESPRSPAQGPARQTAAVPKQMGNAPVRKQRRIKDPYYVEGDDEDEEQDDILMGLPNKREEQGMSMIDFLKSSEPPADYNTRGSSGGGTSSYASKQAAANKEFSGGRGAATSSVVPEFLKENRGPTARSSRDSFGSIAKADKQPSSRRSSLRSNESSKPRFSFFRKVGVSG